ncbi:MAG: hypothetical protein ABI684_07385 [Nitrospirota bacterium]
MHSPIGLLTLDGGEGADACFQDLRGWVLRALGRGDGLTATPAGLESG